MKAIAITISVCSLLLFSMQLAAQSVAPAQDTVKWSAGSFVDVNADTSLVLQSEFITYGSDSIAWTQYNGDRQLKRVFAVTGVSDHWTADHYIEYSFLISGNPNTCRIVQGGSSTEVLLTFTKPGQPALAYTFMITAYFKQTGH